MQLDDLFNDLLYLFFPEFNIRHWQNPRSARRRKWFGRLQKYCLPYIWTVSVLPFQRSFHCPSRWNVNRRSIQSKPFLRAYSIILRLLSKWVHYFYFQYEAKVDEICWELCKSNYLERDNPLLPDDCVYMLFRIFCMLGEMVENDKGMPEVVMAATEVENAAFR